jgi:hypothetical protein
MSALSRCSRALRCAVAAATCTAALGAGATVATQAAQASSSPFCTNYTFNGNERCHWELGARLTSVIVKAPNKSACASALEDAGGFVGGVVGGKVCAPGGSTAVNSNYNGSQLLFAMIENHAGIPNTASGEAVY